jgi:P4 family phage/plasmid primase-like protien
LRTQTIEEMLAMGWVLFPLAGNSKTPPKGVTGHLAWNLEDSRDAIDLLQNESMNVGLVTGAPSDVVVIDVDPRHGGKYEDVERIANCQVNTRVHETQSGGWHFIFRYPEGVSRVPCSVGRLSAGIDVRADGGYIVAPPSTLDGNSYTVLHDRDMEYLPPGILNKLLVAQNDIPDTHYQFHKDHYADVVRWHNNYLREAKNAQDGERDNVSYSALCRSLQLVHTVPDHILSYEEVVTDYTKKLPYAMKGLTGKLDRAWKFASETPRPHPSVTLTPRPSDEKITPRWIMSERDTPDADNLDESMLNDTANATRLVEVFKNRIRYVEGLGWLIWDGKVWRPENENSASVLQMVSREQENLRIDLKARVEAGMSTKAASAHITYSLSLKGLKNALELMKSRYSIRLTPDELDNANHLLTVRNGVVDLRTGMLHSHDPALHLTRLVDIDFHVDAKAPRWEQFLAEVMPEMPDMPAFLQRLVGYGITGETSEHCLAIHYGTGSNGKSIYLDTLRNLFGSISAVTDWSSFERKRDGAGSSRPDLVRLRGARLVTVNEADSRASIDEAQVKRMASGDRITARALYQSEIEFYPNFLLQMATNAKPDITGGDEGIWRRVKLIPWQRFFESHERDHTLADTLLNESEGILAWAVKGSVDWYAAGLQEPERVRNATQDYRESSDILGGFIDALQHGGWVCPESNKTVPSAWTYTLYQKWAETQGYRERDMLRQKTFKAALEERGFNSKRTRDGNVYLGLAANLGLEAVRGHRVDGNGIPDRATGDSEAKVINI